jgi:regulatory protein
MQKKKLTKQEALIKARTYCNFRERCHKEVRDKLYELGLWKKDVEELMSVLIEDGLLNEERFAKAFVRGYFTNKRWGKRKLIYELKSKQVGEKLIMSALDEISQDDYHRTIKHLATKKQEALKHLDKQEIRRRTVLYLQQKGYDYSDILSVIDPNL